MKILGRNDNTPSRYDNYICELTKTEVNLIAGVQLDWFCGQVIQLDKRFEHIRNIMLAQDRLDLARERLLMLAESLKHVDVIVKDVTEIRK